MSNRGDKKNMSHPRKHEVAPNLRFPEFEGKENWEKVHLGDLGKLIAGLTYSPDDVRNNGLLVLRSSNVQNGAISLSDNVYVDPKISGANLSKVNDILICVRNGSKALIGKNALIPDGMPLCTHGAFMAIFRSKSAKFVFQLFQTQAYQKQVDGDLGATINSINGSQLKRYKFYVPPSPDEQKKIADCLSSIDELISAERKKIDALKMHKKGLMQSLFPTEGEKVPKLRFPEFQYADAWNESQLGEISTIRSGTTPLRSNSEFYVGGDIPWVKTGDLNNSFIERTEEYITDKANARINPVGSILVAMYGGFNQIGRTGYLMIPAATNQALSVLNVDDNKVVPSFLLMWLNAKVETWKKIASSSRKDPNITGADVAKFPIKFPCILEQKRIANCLAALDDLITSQAKKINALTTHKQGLMQQLFPSQNEVQG